MCWPTSHLRSPPITRLERVETPEERIISRYDPKLQAFLDFVLSQYVQQGVKELDQEKLGSLLELKYHTIDDATSALGSVRNNPGRLRRFSTAPL